MSRSADFYFDFGSPACYLAYMQLPGVAERTTATIHYKPILLRGVLQAAGNPAPLSSPAQRRWMLEDLAFFAHRLGIRYVFNPHAPLNTLSLMRGAIYAQREGFLQSYADVIYQAIWADGRNLGHASVVGAVLRGASLPADSIQAAAHDPFIKNELLRETRTAVDRGLFDAPALIVDDTLFFGQDRISYAEELLAS